MEVLNSHQKVTCHDWIFVREDIAYVRLDTLLLLGRIVSTRLADFSLLKKEYTEKQVKEK